MFLQLSGFGQTARLTDAQLNNSGANKLVFANSRSEAANLAKADITKGRPFLLLKSGEASIEYFNDSQFQKDFKVFFYDFGCIGPDNEFVIEYNRFVFKHLTNIYGNKWMGKVRKDVIGIKEFKRYGK